MIKNTKVGESRIRALRPDETYICAEGCGVCGKEDAEREVRAVRTPDGVLLEREVGVVEVSDCCGGLLEIWDFDKDEDMHEEYTHTDLTAQPTCHMHARLHCPKRHDDTCTSKSPCVYKDAPR